MARSVHTMGSQVIHHRTDTPRLVPKASIIKIPTRTILARPTVEDIVVTITTTVATVDSPGLVIQITEMVLPHVVGAILGVFHEAVQMLGVEDPLIALVRRMARHHKVHLLPLHQMVKLSGTRTRPVMYLSLQGIICSQKMKTRTTFPRPVIRSRHPPLHILRTPQRRAKEARSALRSKQRLHKHQLLNQSLTWLRECSHESLPLELLNHLRLAIECPLLLRRGSSRNRDLTAVIGTGTAIAKETEIGVGRIDESIANLAASVNLEMGVITGGMIVVSIIVTSGDEETDGRTSALNVGEIVPPSRRSNPKS